MNHKLAETYLEILTYLRDHPEGLTTRQILSIAQKKCCFILGTSDKISSCIFYMRPKKLITSSEAKSGKIHKITLYGRKILGEALSGEAASAAKLQPYTAHSETEQDDAKAPQQQIETAADAIIQSVQSEPAAKYLTTVSGDDKLTPDIDDLISRCNELAYGISVIKQYVIGTLEQTNIKITDKRLKISVLEKLEPLYNDEISRVLGDIRRDLEQLEEN